MKWQPMATAPNNTDDVLLYCSDTNEQMIGFRISSKGLEHRFGVEIDVGGFCIRLVCRPTHWMPLPEPPA